VSRSLGCQSGRCVALLLVELQDPSVEVIAFIGHVVLGESSGEHEPRALHIGAHESCFDIVVSGQEVRELLLLGVEHVLIGASISNTEHLNWFSIAIVPERHLDPGPFIQHGVVHVRRSDGCLAA